MLHQSLKVRNGIIVSILILGFYFASVRWCLNARWYEERPTPILIQLDGLVSPRFSQFHKDNLPVQDLLQNEFLDRLVNGPRISKEYIKNHQNEDILFFNRIPKTGSEMFVLLLQWLQNENGFRHHRLKNTRLSHLTTKEQLDLAEEIGLILNGSEEHLLSFDRHLHFTNFTQLGLKMPLLFNIVRDPVEKISSRFYYARVTPRPGGFTPKNYTEPTKRPFFSLEECVSARGKECTFLDGLEYDLTIPYFCGYQRHCRELNNIAALLMAKRNAEQWYTAIGVLEELNATFSVLENKLPRFFRGVASLYYEELHAFHHNKNRQKPMDTPTWVLDEIRSNLSMEYEFYFFIKQKLNNEFKSIINQGQ